MNEDINNKIIRELRAEIEKLRQQVAGQGNDEVEELRRQVRFDHSAVRMRTRCQIGWWDWSPSTDVCTAKFTFAVHTVLHFVAQGDLPLQASLRSLFPHLIAWIMSTSVVSSTVRRPRRSANRKNRPGP